MQVTLLDIQDRSNVTMEKPASFRRSACAIANTLDLVGDRWSLLVIRDLLSGKRTFSELVASAERIPTNILADRLKRLEEAGIIVSAAYHQHPVRYAYSLSPKGLALGDVLLALVRWGKQYIPGTKVLKTLARTSPQLKMPRGPKRGRETA
jgi:DNA-binding HxlR family transcriptional regulator